MSSITFPPAFPVEEFKTRLAALRRIMAERRVDLLILDQFEHMVYFGAHLPTGAMYQAILVPISGEPVAVIRALDAPVFNETSWLTECIAFADTENPIQVVADTVIGKGYGKSAIGIERDSHFLTVNRALELESRLPDAQIVDFSGVMWEMRQVKSPLELACLQVAAEICDHATAAGFEAARAGVNEREVMTTITTEALRLGADNTRLVLMASGPRSAALHGALGHRVLENGDVVHVEMVPHFRGYTSRIMRPKSIGAPTDEQARVAETMVRIQDEQFRAMKPGVEARDVDRILREGILSAGLRETYTNITGYTLGLVFIPRTSDFTRIFLPDSNWRLQENQVFHMYVWAGGMAFSETVVVTPEGGKCLTRMERKLFS